MKKSIIICVLIILVSACASAPKHRLNAFDETDFLQYAGSGDSKIIGQAFLKTKGGDVKYGAGNEVVLVPLTPYTQETRERSIIRGERLEQHDQRYFRYRRTTIADGQGNFEFNNIPAGDYYLSCPIFWQVPSRYSSETTGGIAHSEVSVKPGETVKVVLTR